MPRGWGTGWSQRGGSLKGKFAACVQPGWVGAGDEGEASFSVLLVLGGQDEPPIPGWELGEPPLAAGRAVPGSSPVGWPRYQDGIS